MRNYEREIQAIIFKRSKHTWRQRVEYCSSFSITPHFHRLFVLELSLLPWSFLFPHTYLFTLLLRPATHSLRHCWPMPGTKERLCWCLKKADKWFPSHRKASLDWEAKEQKWRFTLIGRMQERAIEKACEEKAGGPFISPASQDSKCFRENTSFWDQGGMPAMPCDAHSGYSKANYLLCHFLAFLAHNPPLTPLWPCWPCGFWYLSSTFLPQSSALPVLCLKHCRCLCATLPYFPQVPAQMSPSQTVSTTHL